MAVNWGVAGGSQAQAVAYVFSSFVSFLSVGCGCNVNPSISTAVLVYEGTSKCCGHLGFYLMIVFSEIFGMVIGVLLVFSAANYEAPYNKSFAILEPSEKSNIWRVLFAEIIGSFVFGSFILSIKYH
jgi:glycerol uptake facilitator-like aquaporin